MSKFVSMVLFPGMLIHIASHYLFARLLGVRPYITLRISDEATRMGILLSSDAYRLEVWRILVVSMAPLLVSLPIIICLEELLILALGVDRMLAIVIAWLMVSIAICGMPSIADLSFVANHYLVKNPDIALAMIFGLVVFILGYMAYDPATALCGVLLYMVLIHIAAWLGGRVGGEIVVE